MQRLCNSICILIPGKTDYKADYVDFIPKSKIEQRGNCKYEQDINIMEDYHVKTYKMEDLHNIANLKKYLDKTNMGNMKIDNLQYTQALNDYVLY